MTPAERLAQNSAQSFMEGDDEYRLPREMLEISDPSLENGIPQRYGKTFWRRLLDLAVRSRRRSRLNTNEEEGDGLLYGGDVPSPKNVQIKRDRSCIHWCMYGGNTLMSIFLFLIIMNLLFGFATFLQLPRCPDPFSEWSKNGTTSEGLSWYPTDFLRDVIPIPCHSHNDYWRKVPLFSALYSGCISVEVDVWAINNDLYVGHDTASLTVNRTFQSLYVNPLVQILERQNRITPFSNGSSHGVFDTHTKQSLTLLVDLKTDGAETWPLVLQQLGPLRERGWLSHVENDIVHHGPITVVGTGKTPFNILTQNQTYRYTFFDAPLDQLWDGAVPDKREPLLAGIDNIGGNTNAIHPHKLSPRSVIAEPSNPFPPTTGQRRGQGDSSTTPTDSYTPLNSYYASTSFNKAIGKIWWGRLSNKQMGLIRGQIRSAHDQKLKARYWDTPSWPTSLRNYVWGVLVKEGVDVLNVDDLEAARGAW